MIHNFEAPKQLCDPQGDSMEQSENINESWSSVSFKCSTIMKETELKDAKVSLQMN